MILNQACGLVVGKRIVEATISSSTQGPGLNAALKAAAQVQAPTAVSGH